MKFGIAFCNFSLRQSRFKRYNIKPMLIMETHRRNPQTYASPVAINQIWHFKRHHSFIQIALVNCDRWIWKDFRFTGNTSKIVNILLALMYISQALSGHRTSTPAILLYKGLLFLAFFCNFLLKKIWMDVFPINHHWGCWQKMVR